MGILQKAEIVGPMNGINPWTLRKLGAAGEVQVYRMGSAVRFDADEVREYMREQGTAVPRISRPRAKVGAK